MLKELIFRFYFTASIIIPILMFSFRLKRRENFKISFPICIGTIILFALIVTILRVYSHSEIFNNLTVQLLYFVVLYAMGCVTTAICFETNYIGGLFCASAGYCIQHIWARLIEVYLFDVIYPKLNTFSFLIDFIILLALCALLHYFVIRRIQPRNGKYANDEIITIILVIIVVSVDIFLNGYANQYLRDIKNSIELTAQVELTIKRITSLVNTLSVLISFSILCVQYTMYKKIVISTENEILNKMIHDQKIQYKADKQARELINIKAHDLKQQLLAMDNKLSKEEVNESLSIIKIYDSQFKTGNSAIDIILSKKNQICQENDIILKCCINGELLKFMHSYELYSIFGNAIDNAIESVKKLEKDKRIISINQEISGNILQIIIENYYEGKIEFSENIPVTTKSEEKGYHGYGVKSIRMLVEKHNGKIRISTNNNIFTLSLLFFI